MSLDHNSYLRAGSSAWRFRIRGGVSPDEEGTMNRLSAALCTTLAWEFLERGLGRGQVRVVLRDRATGALGSALHSLEVGAR